MKDKTIILDKSKAQNIKFDRTTIIEDVHKFRTAYIEAMYKLYKEHQAQIITE